MWRLFAAVVAAPALLVGLWLVIANLPGGKPHGTYTKADVIQAFGRAGIRLANGGGFALYPTDKRYSDFMTGDPYSVEGEDFVVSVFATNYDAQQLVLLAPRDTNHPTSLADGYPGVILPAILDRRANVVVYLSPNRRWLRPTLRAALRRLPAAIAKT
jgi:hypothetical protein